MLGPGALQALGAAALNIASATGIVFANKAGKPGSQGGA